MRKIIFKISIHYHPSSNIVLSNLNILKASELNSEYPYSDETSTLTIELIENSYLDMF